MSSMWRAISSRSTWLSLLLSALLLAGCQRTQNQKAVRRYEISGMVVERDEIRSRLTIAHDDVPGLMPAMTMAFRVANLQPAVQPGDKVRGSLTVMADDAWIEELTVTRKSDGSFLPPLQPTRAKAGVEVPDFVLRNQDGDALGLRQFHGKFIVLTFIYTRCPFPDYCPLMMRNLNAVRRLASERPTLNGKVHFIGVSIDPEHDTPPVLRAYGERMIPGPDPFHNWDLVTGSPEEIGRMAAWFGLAYFKDRGQITHSLVTTVIDREGRVMEIFSENAWRPEDVVTVLASQRR